MIDVGQLTIAKSILANLNLQNKIDLGATSIELQLLNEFNYENAETLFQKNKFLFEIYPIKIIHTPLVNGNDTTIEYESDNYFFYETCKLAQLLSEIKKQDILVIIHTETTLLTLDNLGITKNILKKIDEYLEYFPNIIIGIENTTPYTYVNNKNNKFLSFSNDCNLKNDKFHLSNIELVNCINNKRVGYVIDYCHSLMTERYINIMNNYCNNSSKEYINICKKIFNMSKDKVFLYHLSWPYKSGSNFNHGKAFRWENEEEMKLLKDFFTLYKKNHPKYNIPITLEVQEKDYLNSVNYNNSRIAVMNTLTENI